MIFKFTFYVLLVKGLRSWNEFNENNSYWIYYLIKCLTYSRTNMYFWFSGSVYALYIVWLQWYAVDTMLFWICILKYLKHWFSFIQTYLYIILVIVFEGTIEKEEAPNIPLMTILTVNHQSIEIFGYDIVLKALTLRNAPMSRHKWRATLLDTKPFPIASKRETKSSNLPILLMTCTAASSSSLQASIHKF